MTTASSRTISLGRTVGKLLDPEETAMHTTNDFHAGLPRRPHLDFTEIEAVRRAHNTVSDSELAYAVGWEEGALDAAQRQQAARRRRDELHQ